MSMSRKSCFDMFPVPSSFPRLGTRFSKMRRDARSEADKKAFTQAANEHKAGVFADRSVGRKLMYMSENCSRQGSSYAPAHGVLYISLDGMDVVFGLCSWFIVYFICNADPELKPNKVMKATLKTIVLGRLGGSNFRGHL